MLAIRLVSNQVKQIHGIEVYVVRARTFKRAQKRATPTRTGLKGVEGLAKTLRVLQNSRRFLLQVCVAPLAGP